MTTNDSPRPKPGPSKLVMGAGNIPTIVSDGQVRRLNPETKSKTPFVRKPHLTERPFQAHEGLQQLQKEMENLTPKKRGQRRTNKEKK